MRYAKITAGPDLKYARPGKMNRPELIIAPAAMLNTESNPSSFFNLVIRFPYLIILL
jgi:hypothetical protein